METIKITINKDATISYSVSGVKGKSCTDVTKFIDTLSEKTESKKTMEYYEPEAKKLQNRLEH
jgi:hypothetical protein